MKNLLMTTGYDGIYEWLEKVLGIVSNLEPRENHISSNIKLKPGNICITRYCVETILM